MVVKGAARRPPPQRYSIRRRICCAAAALLALLPFTLLTLLSGSEADHTLVSHASTIAADVHWWGSRFLHRSCAPTAPLLFLSPDGVRVAVALPSACTTVGSMELNVGYGSPRYQGNMTRTVISTAGRGSLELWTAELPRFWLSPRAELRVGFRSVGSKEETLAITGWHRVAVPMVSLKREETLPLTYIFPLGTPRMFRAALFSDSQSGAPMFRHLLKHAASTLRGLSLLVHCGDATQDEADAREVTAYLLSPLGDFMKSLPGQTEVPILLVRGNHDYGRAYAALTRGAPTPFDQYSMYIPKSRVLRRAAPPAISNGSSPLALYSMQQTGPVRWIVLDSSDERPEVQARWLARACRSTASSSIEHAVPPFTIALVHMPPGIIEYWDPIAWKEGESEWGSSVRDLLLPVLLSPECGVSLIVSGHSHVYQRGRLTPALVAAAARSRNGSPAPAPLSRNDGVDSNSWGDLTSSSGGGINSLGSSNSENRPYVAIIGGAGGTLERPVDRVADRQGVFTVTEFRHHFVGISVGVCGRKAPGDTDFSSSSSPQVFESCSSTPSQNRSGSSQYRWVLRWDAYDDRGERFDAFEIVSDREGDGTMK